MAIAVISVMEADVRTTWSQINVAVCLELSGGRALVRFMTSRRVE